MSVFPDEGVTGFLIMLFKSIEWFFWIAVVFCGIHLINTRGCFDAMIRFANWMIRLHDFDGQIAGTPKAFERYRRDMWFLFFLNIIVVSLIQVI